MTNEEKKIFNNLIVEYLQHHIAKIIKYEDGSWCNCDVKLENDTLVIIPDYKTPFNNRVGDTNVKD